MKTNSERSITIKVHNLDNVAVVTNSGGLKSGCRLNDGTLLVTDVPHGHKVALADIDENGRILRYGEVIGYATEHIARGRWVDE